MNDDNVAFVLVSIDDDPERLARYVAERKFKMAVARMSVEQADQLMGVKDTPTGFYVDRTGVVRYETRGADTHGDAANRVIWNIEELKRSQ